MASYGGVPQIDFSIIGELPDIYNKARREAREEKLRDALAGGLPRTAEGAVDFASLADLSAKYGGDLGTAITLAKLSEEERSARLFDERFNKMFGGGSPQPAPLSLATLPAPGQPQPGMKAPTGKLGRPQADMSASDVPPSFTPRPEVASSPRVWGDKEAEAAGLYEKPATFGDRFAQAAPAVADSAPAQPRPEMQPPASVAQPQPQQPPLGSPQPKIMGVPQGDMARFAITTLRDPRAPAGAKELAKTILSSALKPDELPTSIKEYNLYVEQERAAGRQPLPYFDYEVKKKQAGATNVNVNTGEKGYDTKVGGAYGDQFIEFQKGARDASKEVATLDILENLMSRPDFYSGPFGDKALFVNQTLASLGIKDPKAAAATEAFQALSNQTILDASGGSLGNQISNADREFIQRTSATLANTPEGNRDLIGIRRRVAQRKQEVARLARDYAKRNGGRIDAGFDDQLARFAESNPLFPRERPGAATPAPPAGGTPSRQDIENEMRRRGLLR